MNHYDVIIIGAGPTGLMAAIQLARYNVNFLIIDGKDGPTLQSRAIVMTARSMEIYQQLGISDEAISEGRFITDMAIYIKGKSKAEAHIGEFGKGKTDFSYMLAFEQSKNEALLEKKLRSLGQQVNWNTALISIKKNENIFEIIARGKDQVEQALTATYIIGCDGAKSLVRHSFNFSFKGGTYEDHFYVADAVLKWDKAPNTLILCPSRNNFCGFFPMGGSNSHRIIGTIPGALNGKADLVFADIENSIKETARFPLSIDKVNWFSIYKLHHRSVQQFNDGNCFLAGDAAHIHSPAGGQGMNTGLQDAYNLSWKLALIIKGIAHEKLLTTYNEERLPFAKWLLRFTDRAFSVMTSSNLFVAWFRNTVIPLFVRFFLGKAAVRSVMFDTVSQLRWSYKDCSLSKNHSSQKLKFTAGDRLPYLVLPGSGKSIYTLLTARGFHLLCIGNTIKITVTNEMVTPIELPIEAWIPIGVTAPIYILVRPDNYIGIIADELDEQLLKQYLMQYFFFKSASPENYE